MLVQLTLTSEVEITDCTVEVGVAAGSLTGLGFFIRRCNFLRHNIPRVPRPVHKEVPHALVVSLSLVMHLGLDGRGGLAAA